MRIISGKHKSRVLNTLEGLNTRPMTDRMKESVFNTVGPYFDGDVVLDLFGGSGALSLESLSRGASFAYIVEKSYAAVKVINSNISALKEEINTRVLNVDYKVALNKFIAEGTKFDIIFLDPPFRLKVIDELIIYIIENDLLADGGYIVAEYPKEDVVQKDYEGYKVKLCRRYSSSEVLILEKE